MRIGKIAEHLMSTIAQFDRILINYGSRDKRTCLKYRCFLHITPVGVNWVF